MTQEPTVGIVTRTKDRRVLLKRALESILFQSYPHWTMVIVNDGGDRDDVDALVSSYAAGAAGRVRVIHNARSLGMEGASKVGLDALDTDLLIVHDDDDSWAPEFLTVAIRELRRIQASYPGVQGVTTYSNLVMEQVRGNLVQTDSIEPFNGWVPAGLLSLDRMLLSNFIPPISFLFSREAYVDLGGLYEAIPYLGDWDFLIRFLSKYEVFMIPQYLAFYHWRSQAQAGVLGNSVTGEVDRHRFYRQLLLNQWLRADLEAGRFGIGAYANLRGHLKSLVDKTPHGGASAPAHDPFAALGLAVDPSSTDHRGAPDLPENLSDTRSADAPDEFSTSSGNAEHTAHRGGANGVVAASQNGAVHRRGAQRGVAGSLGRLRVWTAALSERFAARLIHRRR